MKSGKLTNEKLKEIVLDRLPIVGEDIYNGPGIGLDCAVMKSFPGLIAVSSDPVTGASAEIGSIAINVACNDIACCGIKPSAVTIVIIAPEGSEEKDLLKIIDQITLTSRRLGVSVVGGHTEISDAVNRFVITTTAFGFSGETLVKSSGAKSGDYILMTKYAALEGTAILAGDFQPRLEGSFSADEIKEARELVSSISVIQEGIICGREKVSAMHDITEGGVMGAVWEMCEAADIGCVLDLRRVPVMGITKKICGLFNLDPYKLISSGSMLIASGNPDKLIDKLEKEKIKCTVIGKFTEDKREFIGSDGKLCKLVSPDADELYKVFKKD